MYGGCKELDRERRGKGKGGGIGEFAVSLPFPKVCMHSVNRVAPQRDTSVFLGQFLSGDDADAQHDRPWWSKTG